MCEPGGSGRISGRLGFHADLSVFGLCLAAPLLREGVAIGADYYSPHRSSPFLRQANRAAQNLRRPSGHRHRERPAVQGTRRAQPQNYRGAGAADGDERDARRHQPARRRTFSRCSTLSSRMPRGFADSDDALIWRVDGDMVAHGRELMVWTHTGGDRRGDASAIRVAADSVVRDTRARHTPHSTIPRRAERISERWTLSRRRVFGLCWPFRLLREGSCHWGD